jgi:hypothetical protein
MHGSQEIQITYKKLILYYVEEEYAKGRNKEE